MPHIINELFYTCTEIAKLETKRLGKPISKRQIWYACRSGKLKFISIENNYYITKSQYKEYIG